MTDMSYTHQLDCQDRYCETRYLWRAREGQLRIGYERHTTLSTLCTGNHRSPASSYPHSSSPGACYSCQLLESPFGSIAHDEVMTTDQDGDADFTLAICRIIH